MNSPVVVVTPAFLEPDGQVDQYLRTHGFTVRFERSTAPRRPEEMTRVLADADAVIAHADPYDEEVFSAAPKLRLVARIGTGYDSVDLEAATRHGVAVTYLPGVNAVSVAELTIGLLIMCARRVPENLADVRQGHWRRFQGSEIRGATLGLVGHGRIGQEVAVRAAALGMRVVATDLTREPGTSSPDGLVDYLSFEALLADSDFVSLHTVLNETTRHLIDAAALSLMKPSASLINVSRGPVVDESALVEALRSGSIAGAALDVFEVEPLPAGSPLRELTNVLITPHMGGVTSQARSRGVMTCAQNVVNYFNGVEPENVLNPRALTF